MKKQKQAIILLTSGFFLLGRFSVDAWCTHPFSRGTSSSSSSSSSSSLWIPQAATPRKNEYAESNFVYDTPPPLEELFLAAKQASVPKTDEESDNKDGFGHAGFRYEWGRWIDEDNMEVLMERVNEIQLMEGAYDALLLLNEQETDDGAYNDEGGDDLVSLIIPRRYRLTGGDYWDVLLHVLPPDTEWKGRWPTGSWAVVRALTGVTEVSQLRGPNRDGFYTKATSKTLRGGGDGTLGGGGKGGGEDSVKYVGGAFRSYSCKSGKTTLLEIVVKPNIEANCRVDGDGNASDSIPTLNNPEQVLEIALPISEQEIEEKEEQDGAPDKQPNHLGAKMGMSFEKVGGLDDQLNAIVRRVLASRANPEAAKRLGVSHVRGILLSGPPGCGKTLLARELSQMLGAREPQIVNGPEILDKFVGEAEKNIRSLFKPAEIEFAQVGDLSALHVIILDEMDAIARKRGSVSGDTTGVRDSVVNQLLAKMDGVKEASNVLVVGLTNRPELLDPALLRPGRLEVQLRVELPDLIGRRDILRIHTRQMKEAGGLNADAIRILEDTGDDGLPARTDYFTGAELAGLVRSAASFALARTVEIDDEDEQNVGIITVTDLEQALKEVRPALGKQDDILEMRYPYGISPCSPSMERILRDLERFTSTPEISSISQKLPPPSLQSLLVVGTGGGGTGATALACWAAADASQREEANYVRMISSLDLLVDGGGGSEDARAACLIDKFTEAREMPNSILVLDDVDQICAGSGQNGYSSIMLSTLRALLRTPSMTTKTAKAGGHSESNVSKLKDGRQRPNTFRVLAATSRSDAACVILHELFDETLVVPLLSDAASVTKLLDTGIEKSGLAVVNANISIMADRMVQKLGSVGCKTALRIVERTVAMAGSGNDDERVEQAQLTAFDHILEDLAGDQAAAERACEVIY